VYFKDKNEGIFNDIREESRGQKTLMKLKEYNIKVQFTIGPAAGVKFK
jgi:hypothetical protein